MRQKVRKSFLYLSALLFPVTLNYFSPYVSIDGAFLGIVSGSVIVFGLLFVSALFLGRAWCAWLCPAGGISVFAQTINTKTVSVKRLKYVRYGIFMVWLNILILGFVLAGGIKGVNPLHLTDTGFSVDEPIKYLMYYMVVFTWLGLSFWLGKRGACHAICWMSPFLVAGTWLGQKLHLPQLKIKSDPNLCINCKQCTKVCPMSIMVHEELMQGVISNTDCIRCAECVDACPKSVLRLNIH